ncbi:MAG: hypothetical protein JO032_08280 [Alphaproteobacteria bacterium]|nr:hypothetical protein [Alphaproteobacteria bacterium]MBV9552773.1 hypothetical protein [Alphaproteobacteria bacterium]
MRLRLVLLAASLSLAGCGWFGGSKSTGEPVAAASAPASSDEILKRDCSSEQWKQQNLGLWYSVCRQPMKW